MGLVNGFRKFYAELNSLFAFWAGAYGRRIADFGTSLHTPAVLDPKP